jgi:hypothetical protein
VTIPIRLILHMVRSLSFSLPLNPLQILNYQFCSLAFFFLLCFCFCSTGVWTQHLMLAMQGLLLLKPLHQPSKPNIFKKINSCARHQWRMSVILATWEVAIRRFHGSRPGWANSSWDPISKITRTKWTGAVAQKVQHMLCKCKVLSSNPSPTKKKNSCNNTSLGSIQKVAVLEMFLKIKNTNCNVHT